MNTWNMGVVIAFLFPLAAAAAWDVACFRIPNFLSLALVALFVPAVVLAPVAVPWLWHVAAALVVLSAGSVLFALRLLGGGDVKIMSAAALWLGMGNLVAFLVYVSLAGAVVAIVVVMFRMLSFGRDFTSVKTLRSRVVIPYGVAIALGAALLVGRLPMMGG